MPKPIRSLNVLVQAYIQEWEQKVIQNLEASKTMLFMCSRPNQRAFLKADIKTLTAVLDRLQGKTQDEHPTITKQRKEIALLRNWLRSVQKKLRQANELLSVQEKITRDVKSQIYEERKRQYESNEYTKKMCATELSMASILNMDLRRKLNNNRKQLQQLSEDFQKSGTCMDVCGDMKDMPGESTEQTVTEEPDLQMFNLEQDLFLENEKVMVHLTMSDFQQITGSEVRRIWDERENTLRNQEETITQLQADLKNTRRKLKYAKEKKQQVIPLQKETPKKQHWFIRLFRHIFPKRVESTKWSQRISATHTELLVL